MRESDWLLRRSMPSVPYFHYVHSALNLALGDEAPKVRCRYEKWEMPFHVGKLGK